MLIGYRLRQRIYHRIIDVVMVLFLIATLFPIFWMVYCSFKGNNEILTGRVAPILAENVVSYLKMEKDRLLAGSLDGGMGLFDLTSGKTLKYFSAKSAATSFLEDGKYIWIASATKGVIRLDKDSLIEKNTFPVKKIALPWKDLNVSKVGNTAMAASADKLWLGLSGENFQEIAELNKATLKFKRIIEIPGPENFQILSMDYVSGYLWLGTDKGLIKFDPVKCVSVANCSFSQALLSDNIHSIFPLGGWLWLGTTSGLYQFNPNNLKIEKVYSSNNGLLSDMISSLNGSGQRLLVGTNNGLSVLDIQSRRIFNYEKLFVKVDSEGQAAGNLENLETANVSAVAAAGSEIFVGSTFGKISRLTAATGQVTGLFTQKKGFIQIAWRNYIDLWKNIDFGRYLKNSLIICGFTMFLSMIFATLAAYALARFNFPGNRTFSISILATQMIPAIMYLIPLYIMFVKFNEMTGIAIKGSYGGLIFIYTAFFTPFSIWILRGFFTAIPVELEEAARIDGCSNFGVFWRIVLPLALPGIIATGIYIFLTAWDELMFAWVLTNAQTMTIPVGIRLFVGNYQNRFDLMMAAATIATLPVMILFFALQRYIVKGLTAGAVKG